MHTAVLLLLGLSVGANPPTADYFPFAARGLKLDIDYKPERKADIRQVLLYVSRDEGQTWALESHATPDKDHFEFTADRDGPYWLNMVIVYRDGTQEPPNVQSAPPAQKLLIDTVKPTVAITKLDWDNGDAVLEWSVEDAYPNDAVTEVAVRAAGPIDVGWTPVASPNIVRRSARFKPAIDGSILVRVTVKDLAGNTGTVMRELTATKPVEAVAPAPSLPGPAVSPATASSEPPLLPGVGAAVTPPSGGSIAVPAMIATAPSTSPPVTTTPSVTVVSSPPSAPQPAVGTPAPQWTPPATPAADSAATPIAVASSAVPAAANRPNMQVINYLRFDLQYQVDNGPSGVRQVDLYVTRDGGRSWMKWSQHDGRETPLKVVLDGHGNTHVEGDYGFRLVAVSGAGLSDGPPAPGSPPEMMAHVDVTPPIVKVYAPTADPARRNSLLLHWEASDRNFGPEPIAIEWSEQPTGPWQPVAATDGLVPVAGMGAAPAGRLANTGSYSWSLPPNLATHRLYLKFTAWDQGGNRSEVVTPSPVLVDLTKPTVRIQGIVAGATR